MGVQPEQSVAALADVMCVCPQCPQYGKWFCLMSWQSVLNVMAGKA